MNSVCVSAEYTYKIFLADIFIVPFISHSVCICPCPITVDWVYLSNSYGSTFVCHFDCLRIIRHPPHADGCVMMMIIIIVPGSRITLSSVFLMAAPIYEPFFWSACFSSYASCLCAHQQQQQTDRLMHTFNGILREKMSRKWSHFRPNERNQIIFKNPKGDC